MTATSVTSPIPISCSLALGRTSTAPIRPVQRIDAEPRQKMRQQLRVPELGGRGVSERKKTPAERRGPRREREAATEPELHRQEVQHANGDRPELKRDRRIKPQQPEKPI